MAIRTDYYLRMIEDFYSVLVGYIIGVDKDKFAKRVEVSFGAYQFLDLDPEMVQGLTKEGVFRHFEGRADATDRIELLAFSLFNHYQAMEAPKNKIFLQLALELLEYVESVATTYSMERQLMMELQREQMGDTEENEEK